MSFNIPFVLGDMSDMGHAGLDPANTDQIDNHVANSSKLSDKDIIKIFHDYGGNLEITNIVTSMFRKIGWYFINFLVWITDLVSNLAIKVLTLFGLLTQDSITKLLVEARPVLVSILAISIMYIGLKMMTGRQVNKANIFTAIVVAMIFLGSLNSTLDKGAEISQESSKAVENFDPDSSTQKGDETKAGSSLLKKNIVDIKYVAEKGFPKLKTTKNNSQYNKLNATTSKYIDINEGIDQGDVKSKNAKKILGKKVSVDENGKTELKSLDKGMFGIGKEQYYRFQIKWFTAIVGLICLAIGHFLAALRVASIILELVVTKIIAVGFSYALQGEKLKSTIVDILNGFISIVLIFICLFVFKETVGFLNDKPLGVWFIGLVAATLFMIDGPKIIERKFGYDAGLSSPWRSALAMYGVARAGASMAGSGVSSAGNKVKQSHSDSNKTNSQSNDKSNNEKTNRAEAFNQQSSNTRSNQESNSKSNGEQNINEQQNATSTVGEELNAQTNQEEQAKQNTQSEEMNHTQANNTTGTNTQQTLDQEMKESGRTSNGFKGVGESHSALWANKTNGKSSLMSEENLQNVERQINNGQSSSSNTNTTSGTPTSTQSLNGKDTNGVQTGSAPTASEQTSRTPQNTPKQANGFTEQTSNHKPSGAQYQQPKSPMSASNRESQNTPKQANGFAEQRSNQRPNGAQYQQPKSPMNTSKGNPQQRTPSQKASINRSNNTRSNNQSQGSKTVDVAKTVNQPKQVNSVRSSNNGSNRSTRPVQNKTINKNNTKKINPKR